MDYSALAFVSGLSFFTMGLAIAMQCRSSSTLRLAQSLTLLAAFGLLHGFSEWGNLLSRSKCLRFPMPRGGN